MLYNGDYSRLILKMCLLSVICDGYIAWASSLDSSRANSTEFFEQEFEFYVACSRAAVGLAVFVGTAALATCGKGPGVVASFSGDRLLPGLLMAYSARFCNLAAFLWASPDEGDSNRGAGLMWSFVYALLFLATARIVQGNAELRLLVA